MSGQLFDANRTPGLERNMMRDERLAMAAFKAIREQRDAAALRADGHLEHLADDPDCPDILRLAALMEELGEVARCIHEHDGDLKRELHQLAGVAIAWASIL